MSLLVNALHALRGKIYDRQLGRLLLLLTLLSGGLLVFSLYLILVKRHTTNRRRSKYISNLENVGKKVVDDETLNLRGAPEYDIVIIGGGKFIQAWRNAFDCILLGCMTRNCWLCARSTSIRESQYPCPLVGVWWEVYILNLKWYSYTYG